MVSGAVVIGQPIGAPGNSMYRPFGKSEFMDLVEKCGLSLIFDNPIEVAYPYSLGKSKDLAYHEGVLVNVYRGEEDENGFREHVGESLVDVSIRADRMHRDYLKNKRSKPWYSDLDSQKVCCESMNSPNDGRFFVSRNGLFFIPHMEILETYPNDVRVDKYMEIVSDLSFKTMEMRIERYNAAQLRKFQDDVKKVSL